MAVEGLCVGLLGGELLAAVWGGGRWELPALALALVAWGSLDRHRRRGVGLLALVVCGGTLGLERARPVVTPAVSAVSIASLGAHVATVIGRVADEPRQQGQRTSFVLETEQVAVAGRWRPLSGRVRVAVRGRLRRIRGDDLVQVTARIRRPRGFANPGGFDTVAYLARQGIYATAFLWDTRAIVRVAPRRSGIETYLARWRRQVDRLLRTAVPGVAGGVLAALVVGNETRIDPPLRRAFTRAGVVHILSVSGLHVSLVALGVTRLVRLILGRSEWLLLSLNVGQTSAVLALLPVVVYAGLAGFQIPTLRALLMMGTLVAAGVGSRRIRPLRAVTLAALALGVARPGAVFEVGFQLSFMSVVGLIAGAQAADRSKGAGAIRTAARASAAAMLATAPLTAFHFHQVSLMGLVANPLVIPLFGSAVVGLGLFGAVIAPISTALATVAFRSAGMLIVPGIWLVQRLGSLPGAAVDVPFPDVLELVIAYSLLGGLVLVRRPLGRQLVVVACAALVADVGGWVMENLRSDTLRVTFLDVGQGDAAVAELPGGRTLVIDAGGVPGGELDTATAVVIPFLLSRKRLHVDAVVMTHAHPDHCGGVPTLLADGWTRAFWWTGAPGHGATWDRLAGLMQEPQGVVPQVFGAGDQPWNEVDLRVLHPPRDARTLSLNDSSLTLRIVHHGIATLLTGDVEAAGEALLLRGGTSLASQVLKVPHHGSRTSSGAAFLDAIAPRIAIISVGAENRYGLPSAAVEGRYRERGICVLRTDHCGAITVEVSAHRLRVTAARPACACPAQRPGPMRPASALSATRT